MRDEWRDHPRFREILAFAAKNEPAPPSVLKRARVELPAEVYQKAIEEARNLRIQRVVEESTRRGIEKVRGEFSSLEELVKACQLWTGYAILMIIFWVILLGVGYLSGIYQDSWLVGWIFLAYTAIGIVPFLYIGWRASQLTEARDEWREEVLDEWRDEVFSESRKEEIITQRDPTRARQRLYSLSPRQFEKTVVKILEDSGYEMEITKYVSDYGVDAIARRKNKTYVVQVKRYAEDNLIGRPELQKLQGSMLYFNADGMIFVTLGYFSKPAQKYGKEQGIMLIDGSDLLEMMM